jgi:signal transduction histidine kinase
MSPSAADPSRVPAALARWFLEQTDQGLFATDCELRVTLWNRWMEIHTTWAPPAVIGRPLFELFPDLAVRGLDQHFRDALAGRVSVISYGLHQHLLRFPPTNADLGLSEMPQSARICPLLDGDAVVGTVTAVRDISDRLASEAELRKQIEVQTLAREAAEDAVRAKDEFLSVVSHEIRTPLNAVLGWTRILLDRQDVDEETRLRALRVIDRNATAQARMIDDLLDVARIAARKLRLEMRELDVAEVAAAAVDALSLSAEATQIEIRTAFDPATPRVLGDAQRLQQIVWNLLSNAVKFSEPGGAVDIAVSPGGIGARLVVADTGHGITPEFLPFVFEPFRQSDTSSTRRHGGLGLGLALVRQLVELHGGTVNATSRGSNQGATFAIELPAIDPQPRGSSRVRR